MILLFSPNVFYINFKQLFNEESQKNKIRFNCCLNFEFEKNYIMSQCQMILYIDVVKKEQKADTDRV